MAIFDPEVERLAAMGGSGTDWSSSTIDGGSAIAAAAAILRQLERLTCATDNRKRSVSQKQSEKKDGRRQNDRRVFSSSSERLSAVADEKETAGISELHAVAQLASIVRMRILAALSSNSEVQGSGSASPSREAASMISPGEEGSVEALNVRARCGDWVQSLPATAIVALSELGSPVRCCCSPLLVQRRCNY